MRRFCGAASTPAAVSHSAITLKPSSASRWWRPTRPWQHDRAVSGLRQRRQIVGDVRRCRTRSRGPWCGGIEWMRDSACRAAGRAAGSTASSRSRMTASARSAALPKRSGRSAGQNSSAGPMVTKVDGADMAVSAPAAACAMPCRRIDAPDRGALAVATISPCWLRPVCSA